MAKDATPPKKPFRAEDVLDACKEAANVSEPTPPKKPARPPRAPPARPPPPGPRDAPRRQVRPGAGQAGGQAGRQARGRGPQGREEARPRGQWRLAQDRPGHGGPRLLRRRPV